MATTRRILKKVASLLGKERISSPTSPKHDVEETASEPFGIGNSATKGIAPKSEATEFFFARVPPSVTYEELLAVFEKYGAVEDLNLFRPFAEARISKGCGIVRFASSTAAAAARAELHDKHTWTPDCAPMVLERVNEKKKRSNISNGGTNELVFTPKFLTKTKETASTQQPRMSRGGSCSSLPPGPEIQRLMSQSSSCSTASAEGPACYFSNSSMGSLGGKDCARMQDRACSLTGNGYMAQFAVDTINSADCNVVSSGSLLQAANAAVGRPGQGAGQACSGSNLGLVNSGQLFAPEGPRRGSFEQQRQQQQQQQQQLAFNMEAASRNALAGQQQTSQVWLQQWQVAGRPHATALDEGCAGAAGAGAYLPSFRPLQAGSNAPAQPGVLSAAAAYAALQPTSLSILAAGQQEQLGVQLPVGGMHNVASSGPSVVPMHGRGVLGSAMNPAAFEGLSMEPALAAAGDGMGLPSLPSAFGNNNECFSTYSNFMDGHPSMQLAAVSASGHIASLSAAANCVADAAAAADCSASLLASGAFASGAYASGAVLACATQQQQLQQQQQAQAQAQNHAGGLASGSNLQLTNGALYRAAGIWDGAEDLAELQKQQLMHLEGNWPAAACNSGYFDLYRSGSSLDSMKGDDTAGTGNSSCSYPNKLSSCGSTDTRHNINTQAAAAALARQQQEQLLTLQEQGKIQLAGLSAGVQPGLQQMVSLGGGANANGVFARAGNGLQGQQWQLPPPPPPPQRQQQSLGQHSLSGSLFQGGELSGSGSVLPLSGSSCKAQDDTITLDVPTNPAGVNAVAVHIDSIRSMSGAVMAIVPQAGGQLSFKLLGTPNQVQMAFGFIQVLLQKAEPC